jgi:hypothetical protein
MSLQIATPLSGAVVLKPDMSHVETDPDIFVAWETYAPVAWDLSDFGDVLDRLLRDQDLREKIAFNAFGTLQGWLRSDGFARRMQALFASSPVLKTTAESVFIPSPA